ncbi:thioredoxin-like protein [Piptocephalis cylindrospora]|uniref:Monothiol glutaredoxin-5, mitochondrial n=1 Tax=Piptocephalis cylindrospora TaxID=1907219 RepID=A0A4P9Y2B9_9FUNG|nr:thioredoxin-like protein [Piptocephalis cylindrospora]|eukprot:RKP12834.1 thioredoxin-like protein [Piptocephalis cylindrospora]
MSGPSALLTGARRLITDKAKAAIEDGIKNNAVCVFMKGTPEAPQCGFSRAVAQILQVQGIEEYKSFNVLADEELRAGIKEYSSWPTIPQVYVNGDFVGGCDIVYNMYKSGELEELLVKEGIVQPIAEDGDKKE